ncbi:MAG: 50S ribosomal protein L10 [Deltaproteobacteria bacterium]|nr:MAG: 50S ribosomal protein L10 [Deltaproteobacteria bacterium]
MNRQEKSQVVSKFHEKFARAKMAALIDFRGLTVSEATTVRNMLRETESEYHVLKNTLAKLALKDTMLEAVEEDFRGPTAVALTDFDPVGCAKALLQFAKKNEKFQLKAAVVEGKRIDREGIEALSKLPDKEVLLAQLLGVIQAPAARLLAQINAPASQIVGVLQARIDEEKEAGTEAEASA